MQINWKVVIWSAIFFSIGALLFSGSSPCETSYDYGGPQETANLEASNNQALIQAYEDMIKIDTQGFTLAADAMGLLVDALGETNPAVILLIRDEIGIKTNEMNSLANKRKRQFDLIKSLR